ncbi:hypothetical protein L6Q21_11445 [Sandaracinobacter sp. RS1-74]|uniref:hypothetical protein n=1 Tax=Sandaracinobacteroides sayramensis TaxID=2913411 RepID=UPI001EDA51CB|nr:hypothetical protein [Sandaracinobacteroides sayramensis]MCG2841596.1 hypothetical protein [Sandaracinobacteroides sayramensis]
MADYQLSETDRSPAVGLKILAAGTSLPLAGLSRFLVDAIPAVGGAALVEAVERARPDILLMDAELADARLAALLAHPSHAGMPVLLRTADGDADLAGLLLQAPLHFLEADSDAAAIRRAVEELAEGLQHHAADAGSRFGGDGRIEALKRDAERVAAALAELVASRPESAARPVDAARIRAHIRARRLRERFFPAELFADPAWDMLLDLAAARLEERPVSVSSLCIAANVPTTTALRWIKNLSDTGLLSRSADPGDARRAFIALSPEAAKAMDACLDAVLNQPGQ